MIDIGGIGDQKLTYKNHDNIEFLSLSEYILIAKKIISKMGGSHRKYLNDDDVISYVANAVMMADWRWDNDYKSKDGRKKELYSYRNQCGIWAIRTLLSKRKRDRSAPKVFSLEETISGDDNRKGIDFVADSKNADPSDEIEDKEMQSILMDDIYLLLESDILTDRERECLKLYYFDDKTLSEIGEIFDLTREAIRQSIAKAINKIRGLLNA